MLYDIVTEELSRLEIIGSIVAMRDRGAKGELAEAVEAQADLYRKFIGAGNDSHVTQLLFGAGAPLTNSPRACRGPPRIATQSASRRPTCARILQPKRARKSFTST
jgi:hypothetical protein